MNDWLRRELLRLKLERFSAEKRRELAAFKTELKAKANTKKPGLGEHKQ